MLKISACSFYHFVTFHWNLQDRQLKIKDLVLSTHERAVRNCPWTMGLWKSYVLALERHGADHQTVSGYNDCSMKLFSLSLSLVQHL